MYLNAISWADTYDKVNQWPSAYAILIFVSIIAVTLLYLETVKGIKKLWGSYMRKKRARLSQEVREIIEDHVVEALSLALSPVEVIGMGGKKEYIPPRITIDEAREVYAKFSRLGFWGLHPRKFSPKKTPAELSELKEQLRERQALRKSGGKKISTGSAIDKLLDGLDAELA